MRKYKLFLDDVRYPLDCVGYMHTRVGPLNTLYTEEWVIVRNYEDFVSTITSHGLPAIVSFDHDLAPEHYDPSMLDYPEKVMFEDFATKTGHDCAKWLVAYCKSNRQPLPKCFIHSMNPVGSQNIKHALYQLS